MLLRTGRGRHTVCCGRDLGWEQGLLLPGPVPITHLLKLPNNHQRNSKPHTLISYPSVAPHSFGEQTHASSFGLRIPALADPGKLCELKLATPLSTLWLQPYVPFPDLSRGFPSVCVCVCLCLHVLMPLPRTFLPTCFMQDKVSQP